MFKFKSIYHVCKYCDFEVSHRDATWGTVDVESKRHETVLESECSECGAPFIKTIKVWDYVCPKCGNFLEEDFRGYIGADGTLQIMGAPYKNPIHSDSLALSPDQVDEHKRMFPNIPLDNTCRPVFTNAKDHQEYMDKCGIRKQTQKIGRGKGKIYSYPGSKCS